MDTKKTKTVSLLNRYQDLKKKLISIGFICQGSISSVYQKCGTSSCRCHKDPDSRHGPYYLWTRKIKGKTVSRFLNAQQAEECKQWIANHRQMQTIIEEMRKLSKKAADWIG